MRGDSLSERVSERTSNTRTPECIVRACISTTREDPANSASSTKPTWTFLTNHARVLLCVAQQPGVRVREVAQVIGVTERCVQRILAELEDAGYVSRVHQGRRNSYEIHADLPLRHPVEQHQRVSALLGLLRREEDQDRQEDA